MYNVVTTYGTFAIQLGNLCCCGNSYINCKTRKNIMSTKLSIAFVNSSYFCSIVPFFFPQSLRSWSFSKSCYSFRYIPVWLFLSCNLISYFRTVNFISPSIILYTVLSLQNRECKCWYSQYIGTTQCSSYYGEWSVLSFWSTFLMKDSSRRSNLFKSELLVLF